MDFCHALRFDTYRSIVINLRFMHSAISSYSPMICRTHPKPKNTTTGKPVGLPRSDKLTVSGLPREACGERVRRRSVVRRVERRYCAIVCEGESSKEDVERDDDISDSTATFSSFGCSVTEGADSAETLTSAFSVVEEADAETRFASFFRNLSNLCISLLIRLTVTTVSKSVVLWYGFQSSGSRSCWNQYFMRSMGAPSNCLV